MIASVIDISAALLPDLLYTTADMNLYTMNASAETSASMGATYPSYIRTPEAIEVPNPLVTQKTIHVQLYHVRLPQAKVECWGRFKEHHYLNGDLNKGALVYVGYVGSAEVVFVAVLQTPSSSSEKSATFGKFRNRTRS